MMHKQFTIISALTAIFFATQGAAQEYTEANLKAADAISGEQS